MTTQSATQITDVHGKLYPTTVDRIVRPRSTAEIIAAVHTAAAELRAISIAGGRHAMGGQQFGAGTLLLDMTGMNRILELDRERGEVVVEAGTQWPELMHGLAELQAGEPHPWGIIQKQTGADRLSIGGALAANVHGRGLKMRPIIADVVSFTLIGPDGAIRTCSRDTNSELFRLAIGGYGLFGVIATVRLLLARRHQVQRVVRLAGVSEVIAAFDERIEAGFTFGDFQFAIDPASEDFLREGVLSCYRPLETPVTVPDTQRVLSLDDWRKLLYLGHVDKRAAVDLYSAHYLSTDGQIYWSDTHQLSEYIDDYHVELDRHLGANVPCTEVITEIYVPRSSLPAFFDAVRDDFRANDVNLVYGTLRLIERDTESFLAWAREPWACTIFNLHTEHSPAGIAHSERAFRRLIDIAITFGGSYYLTYHRFATAEQVEACHPSFREFLRRKLEHDPEERFQSDWYRHMRDLFTVR